MKPLLKELFFRIVNKGPLPKDRAAILMYHSIATTEHFFSVSLKDFEWQMNHLSEEHMPVISLKDLVVRLTSKKELGGSIAVTFDDGYRNNFTDAFPILKRHNFPATIFVATEKIGSSDARGFARLTPEDMREMGASGLIDIEPHTHTHPHLSRASHEVQRKEIVESKRIVEGIVQKKCTLFAYPYGDFSEETVDIVTEEAFDAAVSVIEGTVHKGSNLYHLPRNSIDHSTTFSQFCGKISTAVDRYEAIKLWK